MIVYVLWRTSIERQAINASRIEEPHSQSNCLPFCSSLSTETERRPRRMQTAACLAPFIDSFLVCNLFDSCSPFFYLRSKWRMIPVENDSNQWNVHTNTRFKFKIYIEAFFNWNSNRNQNSSKKEKEKQILTGFVFMAVNGGDGRVWVCEWAWLWWW